MAKHPMLLLLLAVWVLAVGLWLDAEARKPPIVKKLCGQKFIRAAAQICEHLGSRWSRSAILTQELMGNAFPDAGPDGNTKLDEAVASSKRQKKSPKTFSRGPRSWRKLRVAVWHSRNFMRHCCNRGCTKKYISRYC
ncbi:relaxin 3 [Phyllostomus discolor]|uniref:Relaxin 3 n=1 Tax=Phyllostomus discolor TaxID=89673 RepID=A0A834DY91_9CHIR|nr:relaxin 3 [Phyllostomus discolor]